MLSFISISKAQSKLAEHVRARRLGLELTQEGLAGRSGVPVATLRRFEKTGSISLESFLKLLMVLGGLEEIIDVLKPGKPAFTSIDEVLKDADSAVIKRRGRKK